MCVSDRLQVVSGSVCLEVDIVSKLAVELDLELGHDSLNGLRAGLEFRELLLQLLLGCLQHLLCRLLSHVDKRVPHLVPGAPTGQGTSIQASIHITTEDATFSIPSPM